MGYDVQDKICIVTGSASGMGKEFAERLLRKGSRVCISDLNEIQGNKTTNDLQENYGLERVTFYKCDVTKQMDWENLWKHTEQKFGGKVELLVNNAGLNHDLLSWRPSLDVMLYGVMLGTFMARDKMAVTKGGSGGRIINTGSGAGFVIEFGKFENCGYTVAKQGVTALTRFFSEPGCPQRWEDDRLKCYSLNPMLVNTDMLREIIDMRKTTLKEVEKKLGMRSLEVLEVGDAFDEALNVDDNGSAWAIFPDIPMFNYPEMGALLLYPIVVYGKIISKIRPKWTRINGMNALFIMLLSTMIFFYIIVSILF